MKNLFKYILTGIILICLVGFKKIDNPIASKPLLGMILIADAKPIQIDKALAELKTKWKLTITKNEADKNSLMLTINNYKIAIAHITMPVPFEEIKSVAEYNYFWVNGANEAIKHQSHIILSILDAGKDPIKENILFNKVAAALLNNNNALGIYMGSRTLLLKKDFYLENTTSMTNQDLPIYNWIYFGMQQENGNHSIYTYGLTDFNKSEMEIINSNHSFDELHELMFNMVHYVLASDITLHDGETIGMSDTQKLEITLSKGKYVEGETLKISY